VIEHLVVAVLVVLLIVQHVRDRRWRTDALRGIAELIKPEVVAVRDRILVDDWRRVLGGEYAEVMFHRAGRVETITSGEQEQPYPSAQRDGQDVSLYPMPPSSPSSGPVLVPALVRSGKTEELSRQRRSRP
jgi:hypothetical protein